MKAAPKSKNENVEEPEATTSNGTRKKTANSNNKKDKLPEVKKHNVSILILNILYNRDC